MALGYIDESTSPKLVNRSITDKMLNVVIIVIQVLAALTLIFLILLHSGRGGGLSDMFGGGQLGGSMAGSTVVERNLDRLTVITGVIFIFTTVLLALRLD